MPTLPDGHFNGEEPRGRDWGGVGEGGSHGRAQGAGEHPARGGGDRDRLQPVSPGSSTSLGAETWGAKGCQPPGTHSPAAPRGLSPPTGVSLSPGRDPVRHVPAVGGELAHAPVQLHQGNELGRSIPRRVGGTHGAGLGAERPHSHGRTTRSACCSPGGSSPTATSPPGGSC